MYDQTQKNNHQKDHKHKNFIVVRWKLHLHPLPDLSQEFSLRSDSGFNELTTKLYNYFTSSRQTCFFTGAQRTKLIYKYQPNLLFCWRTTNQVDLQVSTKLVVLLANNEPIQLQEFDNK